jgi:coenzyme Q-binding protein COQ10
MPRHQEIRELPYSAQQMFDLVADVQRYPEFLPWVIAMRVREDTQILTVADMIVGFKGLRESFTSNVHKSAQDSPAGKLHRIEVDYVDGPLAHLSNIWEFSDIDGGCRVDFMVDFAFRNRLFESLAGQMFDKALRKMIGAFETRAAALYGSNSRSA